MKRYLHSFLTLLTLFVASYSEVFAATYFVRPYLQSGSYGSSDGSSYANAWNGMNALDTKWGDPVGPGDTVYICGTHLEGRPTTGPFGGEGWLRPTVSGTENARITVSGNCPDDSGGLDGGTIFSVHLQMNRFNWTDSDGDGVYSQGYGGCTSPFLLEDGARILNWIPIDAEKNPTIPYEQWPAGSFTQLGCGGDIYYKPSSGLPSDHTIHTGHSRLVMLTNQQYITIQGLRLYAGSSGLMHLSNADFIRIENNEILWKGIMVFNDSDDGELIGNKIHDIVGVGFYLITGGGDVNAQSNDRWYIAHNEFYNISLGDVVPGCENCPPRAVAGDRHAIGVQGGTNGAIVEYNHIHHVGGEGIVFYNWSSYKENNVLVGNNQRDNVIRYNYVHDIKDLYPGCLSGQVACSGERGIQLGSDSQAALPDTITGNVVHHNVLARVNQIALRFKATTADGVYGWRVLNNVVYESGIGIATGTNNPSSPGPYSGTEYRNNLILNPTSAHVLVTLPTASTVSNTDMRDLMDRNLYYPDGPLFRTLEQFYHPDLETNYTFSGWQALFNLDANSLTADPLLTNPVSGDFQWAGIPSVIAGAGDFRPVMGSPVMEQGTDVGLTSDIAGNPIGGAPEIGAYEILAPDLAPTMLSASKSGNKIYVSDAVLNQGNTAAGFFTVAYYLSTDAVFDPAMDLALANSSNGSGACTRPVPALDAGATSSVTNLTCYRPSAMVKGVRYYVLGVIDSTSQVVESNENNNTGVTSGTIQW
jgi:hypothetical protein